MPGLEGLPWAVTVTEKELQADVARITWWHSIDLGNGIVTPGLKNPESPDRLKAIFPADIAGKTVLDVGAWDGFYSFEAERRGAARVLATDSFCWSGQGWGTKDGFQLARRVIGSAVEDEEIDVLDLSPERIGQFDIVLCLGVLYHMRDPLLALERVASVTRETLVVETHVDMLGTRRPAAAFYPGSELLEDSTNWWGPNYAALVGMLEAVGFRSAEIVHPSPSRLRWRLNALRNISSAALGRLRDRPGSASLVDARHARAVARATR
jgi:tRNA (mo5U34)-methyltransferase